MDPHSDLGKTQTDYYNKDIKIWTLEISAFSIYSFTFTTLTGCSQIVPMEQKY